MNDITVRPACNQLLYKCPNCKAEGALEVPYPVVHIPCPQCDNYILVEAVVITTRTLSIHQIRRRVRSWLFWHFDHNISQPLWASMLLMPYKRREP